MRTKVLCAAALAAGALTSMAQVYSANIVGYVNATTPAGFSFMSNPLDASPNNSATSVIPNVNPDPTGGSGTFGPYDGSDIEEWTGLGFKISLFDSLTDDTTTGFTDQNGTPVVPPLLSSGKGFLFNNQSGVSAITFVGQVRTGTNTLAMAPSPTPYAIGSMLPYSGGVSSALGFANVNPDPTGNTGTFGPLDGSYVETLRVSASGQSLGYKVILFDSLTDDTTTGFTDQNGTPVPEPVIPLAGGFFFVNGGTVNYNYQQILNP